MKYPGKGEGEDEAREFVRKASKEGLVKRDLSDEMREEASALIDTVLDRGGYDQAVKSLKEGLQIEGEFPIPGMKSKDGKSLRFFHFTASVHLSSIMEKGIIPGDVPLTPSGEQGVFDPDFGSLGDPLKKGMGVNLTTDDDFNAQRGWIKGATLDKAEIRLELAIPLEEAEKKLFLWDHLCRKVQEHFGEKKFRIPEEFEYTPEGWMKRDENGFPIVARWTDLYKTLKKWHATMNSLIVASPVQYCVNECTGFLSHFIRQIALYKTFFGCLTH
ncbi:MAG TPA: hypothetical protein ENI27_01670, partial [bacterium]|nr:hypothetical protein [bacterium]